MARKSRKNMMPLEATALPDKEKKVLFKAGLYARLSHETEENIERGTIETQMELMKNYVKDHEDIVIEEEYYDASFTGTNFERPDFKRMLEDAKTGRINCIIVKDLSRLGRNYVEMGNYIERVFPFLNVRFIAVTDDFDSFRPGTDLMMPLKNIVNEFYAKDISKKVSTAHRRKWTTDEYMCGFAPYGYLKSKTEKNRIVVDEATAGNVRLSMEDEDVSLNQKEESNSVSSQRELLESFIGNHSELKDTKVQEYCDDGFTGTKFERPGYMKLMEDVRADKISCIVVKDLSRLGRDYIEVGSLLEQILPLYQVRVIAVNDNYDSDNYDGSTGGMNVAFKNLIYMLYSRDLSNKVSSAMHTRILKGENISGQLRYGYVKDPNDKHKIIVDPEAAEVVKLIFELTAQGKSKTEVANYLNAQGIDTPSAYKKRKGSRNFFHAVEVKSLWSTSSIRDILNDEVYLGKLIWNKTKKRVGSNNTSSYVPKDEWMVIENCHEPIITQELFDMAHANSKKCVRSKRGKRNYNPFYYCGVCGRALAPSKRVKGDILLCYSSRIEENSPCKSNRVEIAKVEDAIMKTVNMYATVYLDEKGIKRAGKSKEVSPEEKIATLEKKVKSLSSKKMMLYSDYKDDKLTREEYVKRSKAMVEQIDELHQEIEQLKTEIPPEDNSSSKFETQLESIINMESFDREKIQKVIKKVIINGEDNIEIVWNTDDPFFK